MSEIFKQVADKLESWPRFEKCGTVTGVRGTIVESLGPSVSVGSLVKIEKFDGLKDAIKAQVVGFVDNKLLLMPFKSTDGIGPGLRVFEYNNENEVSVGDNLIGSVVDAFGENFRSIHTIKSEVQNIPLYSEPPNPLKRNRIANIFETGVRAIDSMLTVGVGQRIALMAGSGVGKSTLLGMIAKFASSDVNVIALIGERGREVREFIERDLGEEGIAKSVVVVATGDSSPLERIRAAYLATSYAEYFRAKGKNVCFLLDSVTRFAMAQREVGLSIGEPPSTKGYTPTVFATLPKLLERTGLDEGAGSITSFYTVLVEGDDMNEPIADAVRGILDGHIVLDRNLAFKSHYPAIDILQSVSRVMSDIVDKNHNSVAQAARLVLATYKEVEDLISIGAYQKGQNQRIDYAVDRIDNLNSVLRQDSNEHCSISDTLSVLTRVVQ